MGSLYEDDTDIENADTFEEKSVVIKTDEEAHTFAAPTDKTNTTELLSSSKIAKKLKLSTDEFMKSLVDSNFLIEKNGELVLTEAGKNLGAEHIKEGRFGSYFKWPANFDVALLKKTHHQTL